MNYIELLISILAGLATCIPLVIKLVEYVQTATKEKNWNILVSLILDLMVEAELNIADGPTRKEWVLAMVETSANSINYNIDLDIISAMIDSLCDMSKCVNVVNEEVVIQSI